MPYFPAAREGQPLTRPRSPALNIPEATTGPYRIPECPPGEVPAR